MYVLALTGNIFAADTSKTNKARQSRLAGHLAIYLNKMSMCTSNLLKGLEKNNSKQNDKRCTMSPLFAIWPEGPQKGIPLKSTIN